MKTVICLFNYIDNARLAIESLLLSSFELQQMNLIVQETIAKNKLLIAPQEKKVEKAIPQYPMSGMERLLAGKQGIHTPDAGLVLCAGFESLSTVKRADYKTDAGLKSALMDFQLSENAAEYFRVGISEGGVLFWIRADDQQVNDIVKIMDANHGRKIMTV